ncbi:MAG: hypothetical protein U0Q47_05205 [Mycobacterium sp.]
MSHRPSDPVALRGLGVGCLTAALALASHGAAGGPVSSGAALILLALLAAGFGGLAFTLDRADEPAVLLVVLGAGQVVGHLMLAAAGHSHAAVPDAGMLAGHLVAVLIGALLIAGAERLCRALSNVLRGAHSAGAAAPVPRLMRAPALSQHPQQSRLLVAASISHRGPPAEC